MNSNLKLKIAMTSAGVLMSGAALAGAPISFDQFTATAGVIADTSTQCNGGGWTCVNLDATGVGILTQQITDPVSGVSYLRNINVESDANGTAATLAFSNEVYVYASGLDRNNVALKQRINDTGGFGGGGAMTMTAEIFEGAYRSDGAVTDPASGGAGGAEMSLVQSVGAGGTFTQTGLNGNVRQRIDQAPGNALVGRFTWANVAGATSAPTAAGTLGGTTMPTLAYNAGNNLQTVWIGQDFAASAGGLGGNQFGYQEFTNVTAGTVAKHVSNDGTGFVFTSNGPWDWPTGIFPGSAPAAP